MKLAIHGGKKIRRKPFPAQETFDNEEMNAVNEVFYKGILSNYRGSFQPEFWGGDQCQELEKKFCEKFNVKYSLAVNSCTSALHVACGAIGIEPGDEVIVTPWSMSCSATAPMIWGGIPVFADIEYDYFCLDPESVESRITDKTKAIIVVDLFGQTYNEEINRIARKYGLKVIEDAAQSPGSIYLPKEFSVNGDKYSGTLGDIGCFSFTQGKHLTAGEGGMITTNDPVLYEKCALIRNHAESVIHAMPSDIQSKYLMHSNMIGFNMRMTEIQAAILNKQLDKLDKFIEMRRSNVADIDKLLSDIDVIKTHSVREDAHHVYYCHPFFIHNAPVHRNKFIDAVKAELTGEEGRPNKPMLGCGYITPLYRFPLFTFRQHWSIHSRDYSQYSEMCPNVEKLWKDDFFLNMYHGLPLTFSDTKDVSDAFHKVYENIGDLHD